MTKLNLGFHPSVVIHGILVCAIIAMMAPWRAFECGPDEGMEFSKALLLLRHPEMAMNAWNDQPWFSTQVLASIFLVSGVQLWLPRLMTCLIVFGTALSLIRLMPTKSNWLHWSCSWLFLWTWPMMPHLAVSSMLELPAFGLATIAAAILPRCPAEWRPWRFVLSGAAFAFAVGIKLTALILLPATLVLIFRVWWVSFRRIGSSQNECCDELQINWWFGPAVAIAVFAAISLLIVWRAPVWDTSLLFGSHLSAGAALEAARYPFAPAELLKAPGVLVGAFLAVYLLWRRRGLWQVCFSVSLLTTVFFIHMLNRPWWYYYTVHFAVPFSVLGGWGVGELIFLAVFTQKNLRGRNEQCITRQTATMLAGLAMSLWIGFQFGNVVDEFQAVAHQDPVNDKEPLKIIDRYASRVNYVFTRDNILAAHAGYLLPPELTVLAKKRFWSGSIDEETVLKIVKEYNCEILILFTHIELNHSQWNDFVSNEYVNVWSNGTQVIFVSKRLDPTPVLDRRMWLDKLGILQMMAMCFSTPAPSDMINHLASYGLCWLCF